MSNYTQKESVQKSRNLSVSQLFEVLQEEYIVCELRFKIYPILQHKDYWKGLMQKKKEKIIDIAKKNNLFSIFDDSRVKIDFEKRVIHEIGYPTFIYKDDNQRLLQEKWDYHNYYLPKTEVKVYNEDGKLLVGTIESVDFANNKISISIEKATQEYSIETVTRVL